MRRNTEIESAFSSIPHRPKWDIVPGTFSKPTVKVPGEPPYLVSPVNETVSIYCCPANCYEKAVCTPVRFHWFKAEGSNSYEIQISNSPDFKQFYDWTPAYICLISKTVDTNEVEIDLARECCFLIYSSKIYWRVRARFGQYYSKWSEVGVFDLSLGTCGPCGIDQVGCPEDIPCGACQVYCETAQCGACEVACQYGECWACESDCEHCEYYCMSSDVCGYYEGCIRCEYCLACQTCESQGCWSCDWCDVCERWQGCGLCQHEECCQACQYICEFCETNEDCLGCQVCQGCDAACQGRCQVCETDICSFCEFTCQSSCERQEEGCQGCEKYCEKICQDCQSFCEKSCQSLDEGGCIFGCETKCQDRCEYNCQLTCESHDECSQCSGCQWCEGNACQTTCEGVCLATCQGCEVRCQMICQYACQSNCETASCQSTQKPEFCGNCEFLNQIGCGYRIGKGGITGGCNGPCDDSDYVECDARNLRNKYLVYFIRNHNKPLPWGWEEKDVPHNGVVEVLASYCQTVYQPNRMHFTGYLRYGSQGPYPLMDVDLFSYGYSWFAHFHIWRDGYYWHFKSGIYKICDGNCSPVGDYYCYDPEDGEQGYFLAYVLET